MENSELVTAKMSSTGKPDEKRKLIAVGLFCFLLLILAIESYRYLQTGYWFGVISLSAVGLQIIVAGWIYYDVKNHGVETDIYIAAFVIPVIGILALPIYLSFIRDSRTETKVE